MDRGGKIGGREENMVGGKGWYGGWGKRVLWVRKRENTVGEGRG